ncbi:LPXTG cell wall anchor domain-containing protein [Enterococcus gilvus]|uniref:bifunctional metallophosphatase/5'-nucleotidase n=2 Tax=Enterococcus gilvus TaxID=160453 RepID=UPI000DF5E05E|nr:bifunctional metallophosphatase/5'-nucleotidase [Enterococcus gilvus]AXG37337.1 LPXTG cell wall anchor domain-containing protein [Enterococcus gilvus]
MKKSKIFRSAITLFTILGVTLPSGAVVAETLTSETATSQSAVSSSSEEKSSEEISATTSSSAEATTTSSAPVTAKAAKAADTVPVQLLGINDFHGALSTTGSYYGADGSKISGAGTAALLAGYFSQAENNFQTAHNNEGKSLRVQAGDMVGASPANSGLLQDQPTMRILNQMNFSVGTLGNHEFDEGLGEFNRILTGTKPDPASGFYDIVTQYNNDYSQDQLKGGFDLVIANVKEKDSGNIPFGWTPYTVKNVGTEAEPINIGFIGVVTTEIPNLVLAQYHKDYTFSDPAEEIAKYSKELVGKGVNAIVVLGHTPSVQGAGESVSGETADIMNKVNQVDPDNSVDAFFAGHNHVYTNGVVGDTRIVQSTSQGKGYIDLQGEIDKTTKDFVTTPTATVSPVIPNNGVSPDTGVQGIVADADNRVKAVTEEKIGTADKAEDITRTVNELGESPVGNLVTDAQVYMANKKGEKVDFAITNNGGIRDDLKVKSDAAITWGAAQAVQPFGNIMQIVEMTGQQLKNVLNQQTFNYDEEKGQASGYYLQLSGLKYTVEKNPDSAAANPYVVKEMKKADGTAIDPNGTYKLIINDFLYGGGDGFSEFTKANLVGALDPDTETFISYIQDLEANGKKVSARVEGRKSLATTDPAKEETEKINAETTINAYREGDKALTGKTIPNGKVTVAPTTARALAQGTADNEGNFTLPVDQLGLKEGQEVTVTIAGEQGGEASFKVKVLPKATNPQEEETKRINNETEVDPLYEGEQYLTGKTIPNATVEAAVSEDATVASALLPVAVQAAEVPQKADANGEFKLDVQGLNLKEGDKVHLAVTGEAGGRGDFTVEVLGDHAAKETERLKKETKIANLYEGDTQLTGKTIPEATIDVSLEKSDAFALGKSDAKGTIILDIKALELTVGQKVTITITGPNGGKHVVEKTVLARPVPGNGNGGTTPSGTSWIDNTVGKVYPRTNEEKQPIVALIGMLVVGATGLIYFKRK